MWECLDCICIHHRRAADHAVAKVFCEVQPQFLDGILFAPTGREDDVDMGQRPKELGDKWHPLERYGGSIPIRVQNSIEVQEEDDLASGGHFLLVTHVDGVFQSGAGASLHLL